MSSAGTSPTFRKVGYYRTAGGSPTVLGTLDLLWVMVGNPVLIQEFRIWSTFQDRLEGV